MSNDTTNTAGIRLRRGQWIGFWTAIGAGSLTAAGAGMGRVPFSVATGVAAAALICAFALRK
jgi:hypothetical protein